MDKDLMLKMLRMMASENDTDAIMGLRGLQRRLKEDMLSLESIVAQALGATPSPSGAAVPASSPAASPNKALPAMDPPKSPAATTAGGMPVCRSTKKGAIELMSAGAPSGLVVPLPGLAAENAEAVAMCMSDVLVAAAINKSRFKLKLNDVLNAKGDIVETVIQAEYERQGMSPVKVWGNTRGEVGALATVLRKAVAAHLPEYWQV